VSSAREIDNAFADLKARVAVSWSNIELESRVLDLYPFVAPSNARSLHFLKAAAKTARNSGNTRVINAAIDRLHDAIKDQP